jgi:phycocyanobilin lyase beta subunit
MLSSQAQPLFHAIAAAENASQLAAAVRALAEARLVEAVPELIRALNYNNPGAAVAAVEGLIAMGPLAVEGLLMMLDNPNYGARAWALRALSGIGDPRSLSVLLDAAQTDHALSVRRAAARGLGTIRWEWLDAEARLEAQQSCWDVLIGIDTDPEWIVRYAAIAGLQDLADVSLADLLRQSTRDHLERVARTDPEVVVQVRARLAWERLAAAARPSASAID